MQKITLRSDNMEIMLMLDFNHKVSDILMRQEIIITDDTIVEAVISHKIIDIYSSFNDNQLKNDEILWIRGDNER